jgi:hypothetical protein
MRRRGVVCTPVSGSDRPIDSLPPNRDRTPASCNPAPAVSHKAAETRHASPGAHLPLPKRPSNFTQTSIVYKLETRLPRAIGQDLPTHHVFPFRAF